MVEELNSMIKVKHLPPLESRYGAHINLGDRWEDDVSGKVTELSAWWSCLARFGDDYLLFTNYIESVLWDIRRDVLHYQGDLRYGQSIYINDDGLVNNDGRFPGLSILFVAGLLKVNDRTYRIPERMMNPTIVMVDQAGRVTVETSRRELSTIDLAESDLLLVQTVPILPELHKQIFSFLSPWRNSR